MRYRLLVCALLCSGSIGLCSTGDENKSEATFGIKIEEKHIRVMRALADMMFSYNERKGATSDSQTEKSTIEPKSANADLELNATEAKNILKVGVVGDCLPFCAQRGEEFVGFEADLMRLLAKEGNYDCQFISVSRKDVAEQLRQEKLDIVIGRNVFDSAENYSEGYLSVDLGIVYRKALYKNGFNLTNQSVGVIAGSGGEKLLKKANIQGCRIVPFDDIHTLLLRVLGDESSQSVDGVLIDNRTAQDWIAQYPELMYRSLNESRELAFLMSPSKRWKSIINQGLQEVMKSQSFRELLDRWSLGKI